MIVLQHPKIKQDKRVCRSLATNPVKHRTATPFGIAKGMSEFERVCLFAVANCGFADGVRL